MSERSGRLFAVRLRKEDLTSHSEYRGTVRDVVTGAFRGFREWSDLVAFMVANVEKDSHPHSDKGGERDVGG
jgi:hypothetical protein